MKPDLTFFSNEELADLIKEATKLIESRDESKRRDLIYTIIDGISNLIHEFDDSCCFVLDTHNHEFELCWSDILRGIEDERIYMEGDYD